MPLTARPVVRYVALVFVIIIALHSILTFTHAGYSRATSLSSLLSPAASASPDKVPAEYFQDVVPDYAVGLPNANPDPNTNHNGHLPVRKANATLLMLARNSDLEGAVKSVREVEDRFNRKFGYPWVFLNEEEFSEGFKKRISVLTTAPVSFGRVPAEHWYPPSWIDEQKAAAGRKKLQDEGVIYGGSESYRNMCRFNSGFFFRHPLLTQYRYYWRVEPDVHFHCEVDFDPFLFMGDHGKVYGFTITMYEFEKTIPTLWAAVRAFVAAHPAYVARENAAAFVSDDGEGYNLCHFWSNFEIADMEFWRGEAYTKFFEHLDRTGGFYYERWGDAPVHSIAAALFARRDQLHFFNEIGYEHNPYTHCPQGEDVWARGRCACDRARSFDYDGYSCMARWDRVNGKY